MYRQSFLSLLIVVTMAISGCTKTQEVFDRELFFACVQASGQQDDVDQDTIYACNSASTYWVRVD